MGKKIFNVYYDNPNIKQGILFDNNADGSFFTFRPILDANILQITKNDKEALVTIDPSGNFNINGDLTNGSQVSLNRLNENKVSKSGDTINGTLIVTNGTNTVGIFADGEGGTINLDNIPVNRALQQDVCNGAYRAYLYQIDPWQYLNDITIHPDKVTTPKDFVNGNGISLNSLNEKFNNYEPVGNFVKAAKGHGIELEWNSKGLSVIVDGSHVGYVAFR